jgi:hypothetical protein
MESDLTGNKPRAEDRPDAKKQKGLGSSPKPLCRPGKAQSYDSAAVALAAAGTRTLAPEGAHVTSTWKPLQ